VKLTAPSSVTPNAASLGRVSVLRAPEGLR
jgi:hypothetical protein